MMQITKSVFFLAARGVQHDNGVTSLCLVHHTNCCIKKPCRVKGMMAMMNLVV